MHGAVAIVGWDRSSGSFDGLKRPALRKEEENPVPAHVIGPHPVIFVDAGESKDIAVEGGSPVEIGDIKGGFKNSVELRHLRSSDQLPINISRGAPISRL
ncbi:hypothetical protein MAE02_37540 [Microvirga aerophila]|uniref:Uncharacterized protein n=1 Tax=Microvirga aerophila TaxID=670291 RepID=A0A512BVR5_9HYPH|nr:hypothetical protein MAE02_37540 [Microvirga aerophila]